MSVFLEAATQFLIGLACGAGAIAAIVAFTFILSITLGVVIDAQEKYIREHSKNEDI